MSRRDESDKVPDEGLFVTPKGEEYLWVLRSEKVGHQHLFLPRDPVIFHDVPGAYTRYPGIEVDIVGADFVPFRFERLRVDASSPLEERLASSMEKAAWEVMMNQIFARELVFDPGVMGLQSGGRSCLGFHDGRMFRIKGAAYGSQFQLTDDRYGPFGSNTKFLVEREIKNMETVKNRVGDDTVPYSQEGWFDFGERYLGKEPMWAGVFKVRGDTRLDEVIYLLGRTDIVIDGLTNSRLVEEFRREMREAEFTLGRIAGARLRELHDAKIPWSNDCHRTNSHLGNFCLYDSGPQITTIGLVDLDSCGASIKSRSEREELMRFEYHYLVECFNPFYLTSIARDDGRTDAYLTSLRHHSTIQEGFIDGYHHRHEMFTSTAPLVDFLARAELIGKAFQWPSLPLLPVRPDSAIKQFEEPGSLDEVSFRGDGYAEWYPQKMKRLERWVKQREKRKKRSSKISLEGKVRRGEC